MDSQSRLLTGWKEIEDFIGLKRQAILQNGFPVRKTGKLVQAMSDEILSHAKNMPLINSQITANHK